MKNSKFLINQQSVEEVRNSLKYYEHSIDELQNALENEKTETAAFFSGRRTVIRMLEKSIDKLKNV